MKGELTMTKTTGVKLTDKNYIARDIGWLGFNSRVLYQTTRKQSIPLIERLKFLGITSSNLDEFLMVRVSDARYTDTKLYRILWDNAMRFKEAQEKIYHDLVTTMEETYNTRLLKYKQLNDAQKNEVSDIFQTIYPMLVPLVYQPTIEFPRIDSKELCIFVEFQDGDVGVIPISRIARTYRLSDDSKGHACYISAEEIVYQYLSTEVFIDSKVASRTTFRILREAAGTVDQDKNRYIVDRMKDVLREREISDPIILEVGSKNISHESLRTLCSLLHVDKSNVYRTDTLLDFTYLIGKPFAIGGDYELYEPFYPKELQSKKDIFEVIDDRDIILHHPFDSYDPVIQFVSQAADDKNVVSIRQTLYRVSSESSPIVEALCRASKKGKDVSVLLEIKARFDEQQNIALIDKLKESGCKVIYGIEDLKTHAKFALVVRKRKKGGYKGYAHIGTGNYNDQTSSIYTDISLFTEDRKICRDLITIFNILSGKSNPRKKVEKINFAPYNIRSSIYALIDREVENVKKGKKGLVMIKVNSISDPEMVQKIYDASEKGVAFNIICRGICSIMPINKNITIRSVIGRFLEHSRIFYFFNNGQHEMFISSADLLTRNLDRRVEIMVPIGDKNCRNQISRILLSYLSDEQNTFTMDKSGRFIQPKDKGNHVHNGLIEEVIKSNKLKKKEMKIAHK